MGNQPHARSRWAPSCRLRLPSQTSAPVSLTVTQGGAGCAGQALPDSTGEERGSKSSKTYPQAEGGLVAELVQARLGRGTERLPRAVKLMLGVQSGWMPAWLPQVLPQELSFSVGHSSSEDTCKDRHHREPGLRPVLWVTQVCLTPDLPCFLSTETTWQPHPPGLTRSRYKTQSPLSGKNRLESQGIRHHPLRPSFSRPGTQCHKWREICGGLPGFPDGAHLSREPSPGLGLHGHCDLTRPGVPSASQGHKDT